MIKKILKSPLFLVVCFLLLLNFVLFWPLYTKGLLPFPGDLLVSFYFPWSSGGFVGFDPWTTRKDVIAMDVIRQIYPWKSLSIDLIRDWQIPFWNPYNFSGTPLLANLQSAIFFPSNIIYLFLPKLYGYISHVVYLPLIYSVFSFIFLRSLKLSTFSAIFGAIVLTNLSYLTVWAEQIVVIQSALFLPLILYLINRNKILPVSILLAFSIFGGHIQTTFYVYLITFSYLIYKRVAWKLIVTMFLISFGVSAIQLIPSVELYLNSARETSQSQTLFYQSTMPWKNLVTVFAPDFFGNPAVGNFTGRDYGNFQMYFGTISAVLAFMALKKNKYFLFAGLCGLIFSLSPFAYIF